MSGPGTTSDVSAEAFRNQEQGVGGTAGDVNAVLAVLQRLTSDANLTNRLNVIHARRESEQQVATAGGDPYELTVDQESLASLLITAANGDYDLPRQTVAVEYLKNEQRLLIPAPLGYNITDVKSSEARIVQAVYDRFIRTALMPYHELQAMILENLPYPRIRQRIDATQLPAVIDISGSWLYQRVPQLADGSNEDKQRAVLVITTISQVLQLNCDVRDVGFLSLASSRVSDNQWVRFHETSLSRLRVAIHPYTMMTIAALNYPNVGKNALAAWVRAFGVGTGLLPDRQSKSQVEYMYTYAQPTAEFRTSVAQYEANVSFNVYSVCMNVLAMFGLLHLAKDHTFKSNDPNMERICTSWVMTLRTLMSNDDMDYIKGSLEPICRTCAHPFGLGQTYWLAKSMANLELLSSPLTLRESASPPPVQRVLIILAAVKEWESLPTGRQLSAMYRSQLQVINIAYNEIMGGPAQYSGLHRLYGVSEMVVLSRETKDACDSMMPMVYGFSLAMHTDEGNKRDGLALALSLNNILRENKVLAKSFEAIWHTYLDKVSRSGLVEFIAGSSSRPQE